MPVALGVLLYVLNAWTDKTFNLPSAELVVAGIALYGMWALGRDGGWCRLGRHLSAPATLLVGGFLVWVALACLAHGAPLTVMAREEVRNGLFMGLLLLTPWLPAAAQRLLLNVLLGLVCGFGLHLAGALGLQLLDGQVQRALRWIQPTPSLFVLALLVLWHRLNWPVRSLLMGLLMTTLAVGVLVEARGALLSLLLAGGMAVVGACSTAVPQRWRASMIAMAVCAGLGTHVALALLAGPLLPQVQAGGHNTVSNQERAYLIDYSETAVSAHPWWGIGQGAFAAGFGPAFAPLVQQPAGELPRGMVTIHSPHNTLLEVAVFYGIPAAALFLAALFALLQGGLRSSTLHPVLAAACLSLFVRHGALYGFSGVYRFEVWLAFLLVVAEAGLHRQSR